jgi:hypothetical protein
MSQPNLDYIQNYYKNVVNRTLSTNVYTNNISFKQYCQYIDHLYNFAELTDKLKASLFYGRKFKQFEGEPDCIPEDTVEHKAPYVSANANTIHALLGLISESCELLQNVINPKEGDNVQNIAELGDITWFYTLLLDSMSYLKPDSSLDEFLVYIHSVNETKLKVRYPDKFSADLAINRNTQEEDKAISQAL